MIRRQFSYELLRQIVSHDEPTLRHALARLVQAGLPHPDGEPPHARYQFKHALVQEAAYQVLVRRQRQEAHEKVVRVLKEQFVDLVETQPELLAHHLGEAGLVPQAVDYWERAAQRCAQRSANIEAINHFRKARELARTQPEGEARDQRELAILLGLGSPLMAIKGYADPEVREVYDRASLSASTPSTKSRRSPRRSGSGSTPWSPASCPGRASSASSSWPSRARRTTTR